MFEIRFLFYQERERDAAPFGGLYWRGEHIAVCFRERKTVRSHVRPLAMRPLISNFQAMPDGRVRIEVFVAHLEHRECPTGHGVRDV